MGLNITESLETKPVQASNPNLPKTIPALITESLRACDPELRQVLVGNVVLTGGGSLFAGFGDRLSSELARSFPHVKIHSPGNPVERRYGGWLGGSVLASLGTFHQLWISKEEWAVRYAFPADSALSDVDSRNMERPLSARDANSYISCCILGSETMLSAAVF